MRKLMALVVVALVVPSIALAAKPPAPGKSQNNHGKASPKVMYVLRGALTAYTPADGTNNGMVSILVKHANYHGLSLRNLTLTFPVDSHTKIVSRAGGTLTLDDKGVVKVRGPKKIGPTDNLAAVLQALTAKQVIDQGAPTH